MNSELQIIKLNLILPMKINKYILPLLLLSLMIIIPWSEIFAACPGLPLGFGAYDADNDCCYLPGICGPLCPTCTEIPLDGGLSALLIAGVAYGVKKVCGKLN